MKSVVEYFQEMYGFTIQHTHLPCLQVGNQKKANYLPMEVSWGHFFCSILCFQLSFFNSCWLVGIPNRLAKLWRGSVIQKGWMRGKLLPSYELHAKDPGIEKMTFYRYLWCFGLPSLTCTLFASFTREHRNGAILKLTSNIPCYAMTAVPPNALSFWIRYVVFERNIKYSHFSWIGTDIDGIAAVISMLK